MNPKDYSRTEVLIVGGGPAGLACAIKLKSEKPDIEVCVIEKGAEAGNHNLSGAVLEEDAIFSLLDKAVPDWRASKQAEEILGTKINKDDVLFLLGDKFAFNITFTLKIAKMLRLGFGQMMHKGDYTVSISALTKWLAAIAKAKGVEVLNGVAAADIIYDRKTGMVTGVKLVDQGLDKEGHKQPNYLAGEVIGADVVVLAEGCDGLLTEKFIEKADLQRKSCQMYSVGVKELIKVSSEQYEKFGADRVVHAMGYPLWMPVLGPAIFGGGIIYAGTKDHLSVGIIAGADWKYCDFNPQDALTRFKGHEFVKQFIDGGTVVEAGAKMIPEAGFYGVPREPLTGAIGKGNCVILGDSAGFVNMLKIKGLHNAIESGIRAAEAITEKKGDVKDLARYYSELVDKSNVGKEMYGARKYRQTIAKFGLLFGLPMSVFGGLMPKFKVEKDFEVMTSKKYKHKTNVEFDKDTFTAVAATGHREEQPSHLSIFNRNTCAQKCTPRFNRPCITFCPAGVYETVNGQVKPANPSNCLHCKTCQRKCPFDNIRWTVPEGSGGPRYTRL